jgi:hypothetical protein
MNLHIVTRFFITVLCLFMFLSLSACANFIKPEIGATAQTEARVALVDGSIQGGVLDAKDVKLQYNLSTTSDSFSISGKLVIDRSIRSSFPIVSKFFLKLNFLDGEGRVLGTTDITPLFATHGRIRDSLEVKKSGGLPGGSTSIAFNFFGTFKSDGNEFGGDDWDVFFFPFN